MGAVLADAVAALCFGVFVDVRSLFVSSSRHAPGFFLHEQQIGRRPLRVFTSAAAFLIQIALSEDCELKR